MFKIIFRKYRKGGIVMKNYISINNQKTALTDEQVAQIRASFGLSDTKLSDVAVGKTVKIGQHEFVVLEHSRDTTALILKGLLYESKQFSNGSNDYRGSIVDGLLVRFEAEMAAIVGESNLVLHTVDLTSDDGLKDYGKIKRKVSLLTADLYRRYVKILDKHKIDKWWWLATPFSTKTHGDSSWVKCVSPSGYVDNNYYDCHYFGVRPFCILNSDIFVSN